jgi:hypothetical protein
MLFSWDAKNEKRKPMAIGIVALLPFAAVALFAR